MLYKVVTSSGHLNRNVLRAIWEKRALLLTFIKRDIKTNYAETYFGMLWSVFQPLIGLAVFTFFFDKLLNIRTGDIPYPLFALSGMSAWYYFVFIVNNAGSSIIQMQGIVKKLNFPRMLCPLSKTITGLMDFTITLFLLMGMMIFYRTVPPLSILILPLIVFVLMCTGLSLGIWISALTIRHRDLLHVVPYLLSFAIWVTPVFYPVTIIPEKFLFLIYFNPMAAVVEAIRWSVLGGVIPAPEYFFSLIPVALLLTTGLIYFFRIESKIAEYI